MDALLELVEVTGVADAVADFGKHLVEVALLFIQLSLQARPRRYAATSHDLWLFRTIGLR
ncbi:MAG: hypothetical protein DI555_06485 [Novosphingobium pentaromativorans]|uniref:Uncharacterized protein n=1 Tax=Novosphingobium pentaromativorans TaxID=205844 RepID=A0A2W5QF61_9SPHN|nr:MAG: hypothetical protein DI555_06485 [Novosphingobium pentaromativorans]